MATDPSFAVDATTDEPTGSTLILGLPHLGMAGLTAVNYLVDHHGAAPLGHVAAEGLPALAPFEDGEPRHHTRLYNLPEYDCSVLVGELFVPAHAAAAFVGALRDWISERRIEEIVVLHGIPYPHGPDEHDAFYVATPEYRARRLDGSDIRPLKGGMLDGVVAELVTCGLDDLACTTGVFVTPSHPPGPDVDASLRLLDAVERVYAFEIDRRELERLRDRLRTYYAEMADRVQSLADRDRSGNGYEFPEDRAFM